ncbi:MAG: DUF3160 domain-containing protein [Marinisporobacter sp.]|jgi:hypothetical protein|nr:DUF3160 domain-containing protein [Marinisporobacter sp.]
MIKKKLGIFLLCFVYLGVTIFSSVGCSSSHVKKEEPTTKEVEEKNIEEKTKETKEMQETEEEKQTEDTKVVATQEKYRVDETVLQLEENRENIYIPFDPIKVKGKVEPYQVMDDLSNIENIDQFGEFTENQKKLLAKNGFFVSPTKQEQLFYIYENNEYKKVPSFVTTDSVLQVYHIFYDYSLRKLEQEKLVTVLEELTENMLEKSIHLYENIENEEVKKAQLKNVAYFGVALSTLEKELPDTIPDDVKNMIYKEVEQIRKMEGFKASTIFPFQLDYSQYRPRGHYTRSEDLKRYFKTMMWYGQAPFPFYVKKDNKKIRDIEQTLQALLITYSLLLENDGEKDINKWEKIYDPTVFYVGNADDLSFYDYENIFIKVYGDEVNLDQLNDQGKLDEVYKLADKLPEPKIKQEYTEATTPVGKQFRFMGQRYIPDSEILQALVKPIERPIPSGLDVMGVLGSDRAYDLQVNTYHENEKWPEYIENFNKMRDQFNKIEDKKWQSNMYYGWLWTLKGLLKPIEEGYPSFMMNNAWLDKSLSTAMGSWAELKHDTILYGKQSGAECGGGEEPPKVKGYVEPSIEVYEKLLWLTKYSRANLKEKEILTGEIESKMQDFEDLLDFLINCSVKELNNEILTEEENYQLLTYGGYLEYLTSSFAEGAYRWFEITSETDKNMAVIADIHTVAPNEFSPGGYFEVGVGPAYEIYVVVPIAGKLYMTRGAVFSYYEFLEKSKRLTDEEWQQMIKEDQMPSQKSFMKSFIEGGKEEVPEPVEPYSSGC